MSVITRVSSSSDRFMSEDIPLGRAVRGPETSPETSHHRIRINSP